MAQTPGKDWQGRQAFNVKIKIWIDCSSDRSILLEFRYLHKRRVYFGKRQWHFLGIRPLKIHVTTTTYFPFSRILVTIRMWNWWKSTSLMWPMQGKFWGSEMGPSPIFKKLVLMFTGNSRNSVMLLGMTMILSHITRAKPTSTSHTCQMGPLMISSQSSIRSYWWDFCLFTYLNNLNRYLTLEIY